MRGIVWFRNDLRLHDHPALTAALTACESVTCIFVLEDRFFETGIGGLPRMGAYRAKFLLESLGALRGQLRALDSDLVIRRGEGVEVLTQLVTETSAEVVYAHNEWGTEELDIEKKLATSLTAISARLCLLEASSLYVTEDIPFGLVALPDLFTEFRRKVEHNSLVREALPAPTKIQSDALPAVGSLPTLADLGYLEQEVDSRIALVFKGGEETGLSRLEHYLWQGHHVRKYKLTRNEMLGPDYSSKFSPWLALGCLSPRLVYSELRRYEEQVVRNDSTYWLFFELLWREYFRLVLRRFGRRLFLLGGIRETPMRWLQDKELFERWCQGQTGIPLVDANMRELRSTGYMSNRGRQIVASFLTKNLGVDWRWGAAWFEMQLVDYDVASNYGNWNYAAGIGNDARGFRYFNIAVQAEKYDPSGAYVRHWLPDLATLPTAQVHSPWRLSTAQQDKLGFRLGRDYPNPVVDLEKSVQQQEAKYWAALEGTPWRKRGNSVTGKFVMSTED
jgi:deoxyribodipyrimidine photo-lyase